MGSNFTYYLREAWRLLRIYGVIHIWEATSRFTDADGFAGTFRKLGFRYSWPNFLRCRFTQLNQLVQNLSHSLCLQYGVLCFGNDVIHLWGKEQV